MFTKSKSRLSIIGIMLLLFIPALSACTAPEAEEEAAVEEESVQEEEAAPEEEAEEEPAAEEAPEDVVIGAAYPFTGDGATSAAAYKIGIEMAMEVINNEHPEFDVLYAETAGLPNLGGAECNFIFADTQTDSAVAVSEVERLITEENVVAIVGLAFSSHTSAAQPVAERFGIPLINAGSTSPPLTDQGFEWYFRVGPHDGMSTVAMLEFLQDLESEKGIETKTIAIAHEDTEVGVESAAIQAELAEEYGFEVVESLAYRRDSPSLSTEIQRLKAVGADVLMPTSYVGDAILIVQAMEELDYNPEIVLWSGGSVGLTFWLESVGDKGEHQLTRSRWSSDLSDTVPTIGQLTPMYEEMSGNPITGGDLAFVGYTGATVACDAINRAGSTDPEAIREALLDTDIEAGEVPMPWGVRFDPVTHQNEEAYMKIDQLFDGVWYTVWPFDVATRDFVYPIPLWSDR